MTITPKDPPTQQAVYGTDVLIKGATAAQNTQPRTYAFDDGGRAPAGYKGTTGDCVCRAIAIATG